MKEYENDETLKWSWLKRQSYIHSSNAIGEGAVAGWKLIEKFPIKKIKHNSLNYPNPLMKKQVNEMVEEFYPFGFYPIRINQNYQLKDGQHRLKFAELCGFEFIDVWVE